MCGIYGYIGPKHVGKTIKEGLKHLEYRGYDSAGITVAKEKDKSVTSKTLQGVQNLTSYMGRSGIGHTRWATHGKVTEANAHPHRCCNQRFHIVHNGIIENFEEFKDTLVDNHHYSSETDSEIVAHFIEEFVEQGGTTIEALQSFHKHAEGSYAITVLDDKTGELYALKNKSPLIYANEDENGVITDQYLSSDIYPISSHTNHAYFLKDGDILKLTSKSVSLYNEGVKEASLEMEEFEWTEEEPELEDHEHWMHKEIHDIPDALRRLEDEHYPEPSEELVEFVETLEQSERIIFTASGTSYHAALIGVYFLQKAGYEAQALIASEFQNYERVTEDTTVVAVSQSGETRDVLDAIHYSREQGANIASLTNVPHSTIERESDVNLQFLAGQEICVAATKTLTNQLAIIMIIAEQLGADVYFEGIPYTVRRAIDDLDTVAEDYAELIQDIEDYYILGSGITYPLAREIALKMKEIAYVHAEGMMAGELKHGTLTLIEEGTNVMALDQGEMDDAIEEVESRGGEVDKISWARNEESEEKYLFAAVLFGFLTTYHLARFKGLPIDKPRNLAKSVTV